MIQPTGRALIFRLGETGFFLDLAWVVEICEQFAECFDSGRTDLERRIVGALFFRQTYIPVIDPALHLNIQSQLAATDKTALILRGGEGNWALLVDRVVEISPVARLRPCELPSLLKKTVGSYYSQVSLLKNEPMIGFEPEQYYGSTPGVT
ncbi:MAG: chemotaxis protein CheW [Deltaproteobacteria bacterium]|nr:chemotaxis protein CheW [Deltaproteobacteria bacterium]